MLRATIILCQFHFWRLCFSKRLFACLAVSALPVAAAFLIKTISPDGYERILYTNAFGELTVLQCLRSYYRHDRMHAAQIEGRQSDYVPRWADGQQEPKRTNRLR